MLSEYHSFSSLHIEKTCVTIGAFDGIHIGHRSLLDPFINHAERLHLPTAVVTFDPLPAVFFHRNGTQKNIILPEERASILEPLGIHYLRQIREEHRAMYLPCCRSLEEQQVLLVKSEVTFLGIS